MNFEQKDLPFGRKKESFSKLPEGVRFENQNGEDVIIVRLASREVVYAITEHGPVTKRQLSETEFLKLTDEQNREAWSKAEEAYSIWQEKNN